MQTLYVALGANLGDRAENLRLAIREMAARIGEPLAVSAFRETQPVGFTSPHAFLNAAAAFRTEHDAPTLLRMTQEIERQLGRTHKSRDGQYADRCIDIDLLLLADMVWQSPELTLPHPHLHERDFVLDPLAEIAPTVVHPTLHCTIAELAARLHRTSCK